MARGGPLALGVGLVAVPQREPRQREQSGHREEGHYQMIEALQPQHIIPAHQSLDGFAPYVNLAENAGYAMGRDLHVTRNGNMIQLVE